MDPDAFDLLGLAPRFQLSPEDVERAYLARVVAAHPDRPGQESGDARARLAALLNRARATLLDPEQRAHAILTRAGHPISDAASPTPEFLMQMLDIREDLERAIAERDVAALASRREWTDRERARIIAELAGPLDALAQGGVATPETVRALRAHLGTLRYFQRLADELRAAE